MSNAALHQNHFNDSMDAEAKCTFHAETNIYNLIHNLATPQTTILQYMHNQIRIPSKIILYSFLFFFSPPILTRNLPIAAAKGWKICFSAM
jgi:hypothetical protein